MNALLEEIIDTHIEPDLHIVRLLRACYLYRDNVSSAQFENALDEALELGIVDFDELRVPNYS